MFNMFNKPNDGLAVVYDGSANYIILDETQGRYGGAANSGSYRNSGSTAYGGSGRKRSSLDNGSGDDTSDDKKSDASGNMLRYEVGGMMCEFKRFDPKGFKELLLDCPHFYEKIQATISVNEDQDLSETMKWIHDRLDYNYPPVISAIVYSSLMRDVEGYVRFSEAHCKNLLSQIALTDTEKKNLFYVFKGTPFADFADRCIGQALLLGLYTIETNYRLFTYLFDNVLDAFDKGGEARKELPKSLYDELFTTQDIGFKILNLNGKLSSQYIIKDAISLLTFEVAHALEVNTNFVQCKNCGHYFVPSARSDTLYCNYISPQKAGRTCKEVGAQITRAKKEKTDEATRVYRQVYMKYKMRCKRHPDDEDLKAEYKKFSAESKEIRRLLNDGEITEEYFFKWIKKYLGTDKTP